MHIINVTKNASAPTVLNHGGVGDGRGCGRFLVEERERENVGLEGVIMRGGMMTSHLRRDRNFRALSIQRHARGSGEGISIPEH